MTVSIAIVLTTVGTTLATAIVCLIVEIRRITNQQPTKVSKMAIKSFEGFMNERDESLEEKKHYKEDKHGKYTEDKDGKKHYVKEEDDEHNDDEEDEQDED